MKKSSVFSFVAVFSTIFLLISCDQKKENTMTVRFLSDSTNIVLREDVRYGVGDTVTLTRSVQRITTSLKREWHVSNGDEDMESITTKAVIERKTSHNAEEKQLSSIIVLMPDGIKLTLPNQQGLAVGDAVPLVKNTGREWHISSGRDLNRPHEYVKAVIVQKM